MTALCTAAQVATVHGADPGDVDDLIAAVSALLEDRIGRTFDTTTPVTSTITVGRLRTANLPHWPLSEITTVTEDGTALTDGVDYTPNLATGQLVRLSSPGAAGVWSYTVDGVVATYELAVPAALAWLCARIVSRIRRGQILTADNPDLAGLTQMTVGQWSATVRAAGIDPADLFELTETDRDLLDAWADRRP